MLTKWRIFKLVCSRFATELQVVVGKSKSDKIKPVN
jgi:hypothetical protein